MTTSGPDHWNHVYGARTETALTWFEATPTVSLDLLTRYLGPGQALIDVGGGASRLVDHLLGLDAGPLAVLDISEAALAASRARLGEAGDRVAWLVADITTFCPDQCWSVWHDRAVFHFLTDPADRAAYLAVLDKALEPGGIAIIATFADDGPEECSGLPVMRYAPNDLAAEVERLLPARFKPIEARRHLHITPKGNRQSFQFSVFQKTGPGG